MKYLQWTPKQARKWADEMPPFSVVAEAIVDFARLVEQSHKRDAYAYVDTGDGRRARISKGEES
ncbi:MAG: hypothetical protein ACRC2H_01090 [Silanimonas sp.]